MLIAIITRKQAVVESHGSANTRHSRSERLGMLKIIKRHKRGRKHVTKRETLQITSLTCTRSVCTVALLDCPGSVMGLSLTN